ncbi:MAG: agmatinase [Spirochaetaceae bacterium]|nr:MAG: agmatinase [Spirochaetaceae bacterium]
MSSQFLGEENPGVAPEHARFHVIPAPIERTVSYGGGTARGPEAILVASEQMELFDGVDVPLERGIYTWLPVPADGDTETVFAALQEAVARAMRARGAGAGLGGTVPVVLGGEHAITLPCVRAVLEVLGAPIGIVQFDAHGDLRDRYHDDPFSHASVMRRCLDLGVPIHSVGVRALSPDDLQTRRERPDMVSYQDAIDVVPTAHQTVELPPDFPERVYVTFDVDGLDPSVISATGTPEPGGLGWYQALSMVASVAAQRRIVAFDVVELAPVSGHHADDFAAARLVYQMMGIVARSRGW